MTHINKQYRKWIGTYNNPTVDAREFIERWHTHGGAVYVNGQLEKGEQGTPHIQYYVQFKGQKRLGALKAHCQHSNFRGVEKDNGASTYAMKEDTRLEGPWEFGVRPAQRNVKGDVQRRNKEILKVGVINAVDQGIIRIEELRKVKQSVDLYHQMAN